MAVSNELKRIKKLYGERFMHLCRELFPTILEQEGTLLEILESNFAKNSNTLYDDITKANLYEEFKNFIFSKVDVEKEKIEIIKPETPYEILEKAGYQLYECHNENEIQSFKKYYAKGEELCTFHGGRLNRCVVFFAIKEDAEELKREDFDKPQREDEYGTSVLGIQFSKIGKCTVSIKSRYNHTVNNPDATYGNDLDRIAPGLTQSFTDLLLERDLDLNNTNVEAFEIPGYVVANDGRYYKYNMEIDGIYYCPGNIIINNGNVVKLEPEKQVLMDYFILDKENKTIRLFDKRLEDSFLDGVQDIEKIEMENDSQNKGTRVITIHSRQQASPIIIKIDGTNQITYYENNELTVVGDNFLGGNQNISQINIPNIEEIGDSFLEFNKRLQKFEAKKLHVVGSEFLGRNSDLDEIAVPMLRKAGNGFLGENKRLVEIRMPELVEVGDGFLYSAEGLEHAEFPKLETIGNTFLYKNKELKELYLPNVKRIEDYFMTENRKLQRLELPEVENIADNFLEDNNGLEQLNLPKIKTIGNNFLPSNRRLKNFVAPNLFLVGCNFMMSNNEMLELDLPELLETHSGFLYSNKCLKKLNVPKLKEVQKDFLHNNEALEELEVPNLISVSHNFLYNNRILNKLEAPRLRYVGKSFMGLNKELKKLYLPELQDADEYFLYANEKLEELDIPKNPQLEDYLKRWHNIRTDARNEIQNDSITFNSSDLAELDKETKLTSSEVTNGEKIIQSIIKDKTIEKE